MTRRLLKEWEFLDDTRSRVAFSDPARIRLSNDDPLAPAVELKISGVLYPDDVVQNWVRSWEYEPHGLQGLLMFQEVSDLPAGTSIRWRLVVGGSDLFWDGGAWSAPAGAGDWNTPAEISTNLPALALTSRRIAVKANLLASSDLKSTPRLLSARLLGTFVVDWYDDLLYDTVVRSLQDSLLTTTDAEFAVATTASVFDLSADPYRLDNPGYNFVDVASAFDLTADPERLVNLALSYAPGAARKDGMTNDPGQVTLSGPVTAGNVVRLTMKIAPEVTVKTDQDYYEVERLPAVAIERVENVRLLDGSEREAGAGGDGDVIFDAVTGAAVRVPPPRQANYRISWTAFAKTQSDCQRLVGAVEEWVAQHPVLRTWAFDEEIGVDPDQSDSPSGSSNDQVRSGSGAFTLRIVPFWMLPAEDGHVILNVNLTFQEN